MTDKQKLVDDVVKAAEAWVEMMIGLGSALDMDVRSQALCGAVTTKRAAEQPQPLTAEEALKIWSDLRGCFGSTPHGDMQVILDAAADRWLAVIEALPRHDGNTGTVVECPNGRYVALDDIRRAFSRTGGGNG